MPTNVQAQTMTLEEDSSVYIRRIQELARNPESKDYLAANKYLLEETWKKPKVGRPSKDAIKEQASRLQEDHLKILEAYERINNK